MHRDTDICEDIWYWQKQTHKQNIKMEFLTIYCFVFLLKMRPWGSFQVNEATNVVFMILGGCFISEIVLNLSFRWVKKNTCKIRLHVYTSLRAGVARSGQPIKTLNDKFSLVRKHRSSNQRPWTMIFHRVKFHRSWCRLAIANSERLLRTSISMNKSLYSCNKKFYCHGSSQWTTLINIFQNDWLSRSFKFTRNF